MTERRNMFMTPMTIEEYEQKIDQRLDAEVLADHDLLHLAMRAYKRDRAAAAYKAPVFINRMRREYGRVTFLTLFADQDLRPAGPPVEGLMRLNFWLPNNANRQLALVESSGGVGFDTRMGYFIPYEADLSGDVATASVDLPQAMSSDKTLELSGLNQN